MLVLLVALPVLFFGIIFGAATLGLLANMDFSKFKTLPKIDQVIKKRREKTPLSTVQRRPVQTISMREANPVAREAVPRARSFWRDFGR